jgi:rubrerythrin/uncharacterized membrane protein
VHFKNSQDRNEDIMRKWRCEVCTYLHKGQEPPESCPVCSAAAEVFVETGEELSAPDEERSTSSEKTWRCTISGYLHKGQEPPDECPVCEATAEQFEEVAAPVEEAEGSAKRRWRCTVCGYIHEGDEPPEKCPVCLAPASVFVEVDAEGKELSELPEEEIEPLTLPGSSGEVQEEKAAQRDLPEQAPSTVLDRLAGLVLKFHLHPITVHFPNGIIPAAVVFLALAVFLNLTFFEPVAFFNLVFVLVMLPVVLFTGYLEWQRRYQGLRTGVFITKIVCSVIVLGAVNLLVFWRLIDPTVAVEAGLGQTIYFVVAATALGAAGIAGHLGGKLVFASRGG